MPSVVSTRLLEALVSSDLSQSGSQPSAAGDDKMVFGDAEGRDGACCRLGMPTRAREAGPRTSKVGVPRGECQGVLRASLWILATRYSPEEVRHNESVLAARAGHILDVDEDEDAYGARKT